MKIGTDITNKLLKKLQQIKSWSKNDEGVPRSLIQDSPLLMKMKFSRQNMNTKQIP